ncbi:MAG: type II secretion system protein [Gammaproteobacteria bacterium]|nr:type II secretion system protein [Gammaproteobacteria bacterium]
MMNQKGFTLIELVLVIIILGILAAFIVPRFMSLDKEARIAVVQALDGSVRAASNMVHALAIAQGQTGATGTVNLGGTVTTATVYSYPKAAKVDFGKILQVPDIDSFGFTVTEGTGNLTFTKNGASTPATCSVVYTQTTDMNVPPSVTLATGGC